MSGGSLDYVYSKMQRGEVDSFMHQVSFIFDTLHTLQHGTTTPVSADDIAKIVAAIHRYRAVVETISAAQEEVRQLAVIAQTVEWYLSGDWGAEEIVAAVNELPAPVPR
jgi:hypothetical protein